MKIGDKIVIMRDKYYGLITRGCYNQAKIGTLVDRDYNDPASFTFDIGGDHIIGTQKMHGTITFPNGWHLIFKNAKLPYEDIKLSENLARYVESNRNTLIFHVGAQIEGYTLGNAIMKVASYIGVDMYDDISRLPIALNKIDAKSGSLIACALGKTTENKYGFLSFDVDDVMVLKDEIHCDTLEQYQWPEIYLLSANDIREKITCHQLSKEKDEVLYYVENNNASVISTQGLRAYQSTDISADAWYWASGEKSGLYIAENLAWAGSGDEIELEADTRLATDEEVAAILKKQGMECLELFKHDVPFDDIMKVGIVMGQEDAVRERYPDKVDFHNATI